LKLRQAKKKCEERLRVLRSTLPPFHSTLTTKPKREWVGLTKEDFYKKDDETVFVLGMKFAEARLKEKNT
jgi:hypothetical protein